MSIILAVDTNMEVYEKHTTAWASFDIGTQRANTMCEAIARLIRGEEFLFIGINEDSIPDFASQLPIMRDVTDTIIFVVTSSFTTAKKVVAIKSGADAYTPFSKFSKENVLSAWEALKLHNRLVDRPAKKLPVLAGGDIILSPSRRCVLIQDTELTLTNKEFNILFYLMSNQGIILTYDQIIYHIWEDKSDNATPENLFTHIKRLRKKLGSVSPHYEKLIENEYRGYRFIV